MAVFFKSIPIDGIEAIEQAVVGSDVEPTQLKPGRISGVMTHMGLGTATLSTAVTRGPFRVRGPLSKTDFTLGALLDAEDANSHWAYETQTGDIGVVPPQAEHEATYGAKSRWVALALPLEELAEHAEAYELQVADAFWNEPAFYRPSSQTSGRIVERFKTALYEISRTPDILKAPHAREALLDDLMGALFEGYSNAGENPIEERRASISSTRTIRSAENYLTEQKGQPVRLSELCQHLGVSKRSLNRAFSDAFDLPPVLYLRQWRLCQVRRVLSSPENGAQTVSSVALQFGFWELGRFAQQYNQLFGELPSQTLATAAQV
jgi:AraC family ethanolamine operon transcriptional activator